MSVVAKTSAEVTTFGRRWRPTTRPSLPPSDRAASTYSWFLATRISPRMRRAQSTPPTTPPPRKGGKTARDPADEEGEQDADQADLEVDARPIQRSRKDVASQIVSAK